MVLRSLTLQNFRCYAKKEFIFSPHTTLITGKNAAGKTNVLEAIMMVTTGKSFRAGADREAIRWEAEISNIKCQISNPPARLDSAKRVGEAGGEDKTQLELLITQGNVQGKPAPLKKYLVNGVSRRMVDFIGNLRAVLFWPEDLEIVTDSPSLRRRYLDTVLVQVDREYRRNLLSYERGLRQRNKLLDLIFEGKATRSQLLFWNQLLIRAGSYLTDTRASYIDFVNATRLSQHHFLLTYDKSVISENRLEQYKDEEVAAKATLVGPHRDDFLIQSMDHGAIQKTRGYRDIAAYGSRGEQRLAVLWLKLAELDYIEKATTSRPLLLLDDIFSELDAGHRELIAEVVAKQQTIITSAEPQTVPDVVRKFSEPIRL
ncbi:MAG TPA: DNA replication and repair protein RecF [Patescibacteria group bacterium]|nr:DNA replication and repair protein RecF [Patescibacteria group bacterium]